MPQQGDVARDISYSRSARSRGGRAVIRVMENATGRIGLIRRAAGYREEIARGRDFWEVILDRFGLSLDVVGGALSDLPGDGPLIVIANHPFGILDGIMLGHILSARRGDFRILAHRIFGHAPDLDRVILPVNFDGTRAAVRENLDTRRRALDRLAGGGCIGVFPGGTVSTAARPFSRPMDPGWRSFTARMVAKSGATVVPVYFDGSNSRLFQIASHLHPTLRMGLLMQEFRRRTDRPVRVVIGQPVPPAEIARRAGDARALMDFLREATYHLSPQPFDSLDYGFEFEEKHKHRV